jgi:hypothetical protein
VLGIWLGERGTTESVVIEGDMVKKEKKKKITDTKVQKKKKK